jgi:hypothetical protein
LINELLSYQITISKDDTYCDHPSPAGRYQPGLLLSGL